MKSSGPGKEPIRVGLFSTTFLLSVPFEVRRSSLLSPTQELGVDLPGRPKAELLPIEGGDDDDADTNKVLSMCIPREIKYKTAHCAHVTSKGCFDRPF